MQSCEDIDIERLIAALGGSAEDDTPGEEEDEDENWDYSRDSELGFDAP